jgi:two-component system OmpR family response regulator
MRLDSPEIERPSARRKAQAELPLLVVEDETSVQSLLRSALKKHGYEIRIASSGVEALELLQHGDFRGVLCDMRMPGKVKGADLHAWLCSHRPQMLSRMVFMTGDATGEDVAAVLTRTGMPCIEKPFRMNELLTMLKKVLQD